MSDVDTEAPRDYARLISKTDPEGYAFWTPYTEGAIGDCGIVRPDGQFVKLFNVFAEGTGFECLPTAERHPTHVPAVEDLVGWPTPADSAERRIRIENNINVWRAHESNDWSVEVDAPVPIPDGNLGFGFALSESKGLAAFLTPCGPKRRVETYLMDQVFPEYFRRNYKAICARYSSRYNMSTVCILEGTTHATSWCRGFTRQHGRSIHGLVSVNPIPNVPVFKVECGHGQTVNHPWMIAAGPSEQPPDRTLHLIRARLTVHHSKRPKWLPSWSRQRITVADTAPIGPEGGGSNSSVGGTIEGRPISPHTPAGSSIQGGHQAVYQLADAFESQTIAAQSNSATEIRVLDPEDSPDEPEVYTPNFVQMILDIAFEAYPDYDSLIVNWKVLQAFWDSCGGNSTYDHSLLAFDLERSSGGASRAAFVNKIFLRTPGQPSIGADGLQVTSTSKSKPMEDKRTSWGHSGGRDIAGEQQGPTLGRIMPLTGVWARKANASGEQPRHTGLLTTSRATLHGRKYAPQNDNAADAQDRLDTPRMTNASKPGTASDRLDQSQEKQKRGANGNVPTGEDETPAHHLSDTAHLPVTVVEAATSSSASEQMVLCITQLEAALKHTQQTCHGFESSLEHALQEQRRIDGILNEERRVARQREEALNFSIVVAKQELQKLKKEMLEMQRRIERQTVDAANELTTEHQAARQRERELNLELAGAKQDLQVAKDDLVEAQRHGEQRAVDAANQLGEGQRMAHQREEKMLVSLAEARQELQATKKERLEMQRRIEQQAVHAANELATTHQAARQREDALGVALADAKQELQALKEDRAHQTTLAANQLAAVREAARQREETLNTALLDAKQHLQMETKQRLEAQRQAAEATNQLDEEQHMARQREEKLLAMLAGAKQHVQKAEEESLEGQRRSKQQAVDAAKQLATEHQAACHREEALSTALLAAQSRLAVSETSRGGKRAVGETADIDGQTIVTLFDDLVEAVNELVFFVTGELDEDAQTASMLVSRLRDFEATNEQTGSLLCPFLIPMARVTAKVEHVALPVMQFIAFAVLAERVFLPASLAGPDGQDANHHLQRLQNLVAAREPQEKYSRWRATTYSALRAPKNDDRLAREVAAEMYSKMSGILQALLPPSTVLDRHLFDGFEERAKRVAMDAVKLQDTIQRFCISYNYTVFLPVVKSQFSAGDMAVFDLGVDAMSKLGAAFWNTTGSRGTVLLPVMPGLRAERIELDLARSEIIVKKASVITLF